MKKYMIELEIDTDSWAFKSAKERPAEIKRMLEIIFANGNWTKEYIDFMKPEVLEVHEGPENG